MKISILSSPTEKESKNEEPRKDGLQILGKFQLEDIFKFFIKENHVNDVTSHLFGLFDSAVSSRDKFEENVREALQHFGYSFQYFPIAEKVKLNRTPLIILLGGTSGCGKSTLGSLLALRLGISNLVSTDNIRQLLRNFVPEKHIVQSSSYNIKESKDIDTSTAAPVEKQVIAAYEEQNDAIYQHILKLVEYHLACSNCLIIEGVHLSSETIQRLLLDTNSSFILPFIIYISNRLKHSERFAIRAKYMTLEPRENKYIQHFQTIRLIQNYLCTSVLKIGESEVTLPSVDNTNVDKSIVLIHSTILAYLDKVTTSKTPMNIKEAMECLLKSFDCILQSKNIGSKEMLMEIQQKRRRDQAQEGEIEQIFQRFEQNSLGSLGS